MNKIDFDQHAKNYNDTLSQQLNFFDGDNTYFAQYKILLLKKILKFSPKRILDFGCGTGRSTFFLKKYFPESMIVGCDLSEESLRIGKNHVENVIFLTLDDVKLFEKKFDLVFISCVFHHIALDQRAKTMDFILNLSELNAVIVSFEHNPYNPITRHLVNTCPFDRDAILLTPKNHKTLFLNASLQNIQYYYTLFFPSQFKWLRPLEYHLRFMPVGGQYVIWGNT